VATVVGAYALLGANFESSLLADVRWASLFGANFRLINTGSNYFIPGVAPSLVTHYWSLAVEEQFYIVYPLIVFTLVRAAPARLRTRAVAIFLVLAIVASAWYSWRLSSINAVEAYYSPLTRFWELALGGLASLVPLAWVRRTPRLNAAVALVALVVLFAAVYRLDVHSVFPGTLAWWPCAACATLLVTGVASAKGGPATWLSWRPLCYLGDISYSLYLWHYPWLMLPLQRVHPLGSDGARVLEVAGALAELLDVAVRHDGFDFARSSGQIILVDGLERLLTPFEPSAAAYAARTLERRGVQLKLGHMVRSIDDSCVELDDGSRIPTRTVVWAGGVSVEGTVAARFGEETGANGRLVVEPDLAIRGRSNAYAIGDAAAVPWGPGARDPTETCPQLAQVAIQSGKHAALQIVNRVQQRPTQPFRYRDKGIMATIGRRAAITEFPRGLVVRGTLGWLAWLGLHLVYLIGFRNRIVVLINWSWRYLSWGSGPRVIVGDELERGTTGDPGARGAADTG